MVHYQSNQTPQPSRAFDLEVANNTAINSISTTP